MAEKYKGVFTLQWHITHRCNLRCKHCYQDDYSSFETRADMERVLDQFTELLRTYNRKGQLNITGGEPLTHPDLFWLLKQAKERNISTGVLTNGTLISPREARLFRACRVSYVQVSLDGCEKTHDEIRGSGSFDKAVRGINALKSQGLFTSISFTAQSGNYRELKKLARCCESLSADKLWFDRVIIPKNEDTKNLSLDSSQFHSLIKTAARLNRQGRVFCGRSLQFIPCKNKNIYRCSAGDSLLILLADGTVMPCRRLPLTLGNVRNNSLLELYRDSQIMHDLRACPIPKECAGCKYAEACRGGAKCVTYARAGRYDLPDPDCPLIKK